MPPYFNIKINDLIINNRINIANINTIKTWLINNTNLPTLTDEQIAIFLLSSDNDVDLTRNTIKENFHVRKLSPHLFMDRTLDNHQIKQASSALGVVVIPKRLNNNRSILWQYLIDRNYQHFVYENTVKLTLMCIELTNYEIPSNDVIVVIDMKGSSWLHLTRLSINVSKMFVRYVQNGLPVKVAAVHFLHCGYLMDKVIALLRPFMKRELLSILHVHRDEADVKRFLDDHLPLDCLPEDYGGMLPNLQILLQQTNRDLLKLTEYFRIDDQQLQTYLANSNEK